MKRNCFARIKSVGIMLIAVICVSCSSTAERKAKELKAQGYCVVDKEDGLWYYNADSVFSYDAKKDAADCVFHRGQMVEDYYTIVADCDNEGRLFVNTIKYDASVLLDKIWEFPNDDMPSEKDGIKFDGSKGFVYYTVEEEFGERYENNILYSQGKIFELGKQTNITDYADEIHITLKGRLLSQKAFGDRELENALFDNYGQLSTYTWNIVLGYNGEIIRKAETIHLDKLDIDIPVFHVGTMELEADLIPHASNIKQKAFNDRMNELAAHACDIAALNNAFRNKPKAEREVVGVEQIVIGELTEMDISLLGTKSFTMKTDDRNLSVVLYTEDPAFFELSLPATVMFRGTVSSVSIHDWLVFENCKFEAQFANK